MIWSPIQFLQALFATKAQAGEVSRRWWKAAAACPELKADLITLGGVLVGQPLQDGELAPLDPLRLAYEAGRRDLALQLAAMMSLTIPQLNSLMEDDHA